MKFLLLLILSLTIMSAIPNINDKKIEVKKRLHIHTVVEIEGKNVELCCKSITPFPKQRPAQFMLFCHDNVVKNSDD